MTRLSKKDWDLLDDLIGKHGFGGYYDLVECLKDVAGQLGIGETGLDLMDVKTLPDIVMILRTWSGQLSNASGFHDIVEKASKNVSVGKVNL